MTSGVPGSSRGVCLNHPTKKAEAKGLCRTCYKERWWKDNPDKYATQAERKKYARYNLTPSQVKVIWERQKGLCAVCHTLLEKPVIDHDHVGGIVRGLVHKQCNFILGLAKDNPKVLDGAAQYLRSMHVLWNPSVLKNATVVDKVWGQEAWLVNEPLYCFKVLKINPGFRCSLHYHPIKIETFIVIEGEVLLEQREPQGQPVWELLKQGMKRDILPKTPHRFSSVGGALVAEVSTHHSDDDVVRIEESGRIVPFVPS